MKNTSVAKLIVFPLCALPLLWLAWSVFRELQSPGSVFGADPAKAVVHYLGNWSIRFLLATLTLSSLARLLRRPRWILLRRGIGLFAFSYVMLHFGAYLLLLGSLEPGPLLEDVLERPYVTAGFTALVILIPLAVTSTNGFQRRLGRRWKQLHKWVYAAALLAVVHVLWQARSSYADAALYSTWLALLFAERAWRAWGTRRGQRTRRPATQSQTART